MKPAVPLTPRTPLNERVTLWFIRMVEAPAAHNARMDWLSLSTATLAIGVLDFHVGIFFTLQPLYLIPIILAVIRLGWEAGVIISVASFVFRYLGEFTKGAVYPHPLTSLWNRVVALGLSLAIIWVVNLLIRLHRELEARVQDRTVDLKKALHELTDLQHQISEVGRRERGAIGHELHDGLCQHLTATALAAELVAERLSGRQDPVAVQARAVVGLVQDAIEQTRQIARGLLLANVSSERLTSELEELATAAGKQHRLESQFVAHGELHLKDPAVASQLFWIAQEAVRNALRHGRPSHLKISLDSEPDWITLTITDDGVGLGASGHANPGIGLKIMANRAQMAGGDLSVESADGHGTRVRCRVPAAEDRELAIL